MDTTLGEPTRATSANILAALELAKHDVRAPLMAERDEAVELAGQAQLETMELQGRTEQLKSEHLDNQRETSELTAIVKSLSNQVDSAQQFEATLRKQGSSQG